MHRDNSSCRPEMEMLEAAVRVPWKLSAFGVFVEVACTCLEPEVAGRP